MAFYLDRELIETCLTVFYHYDIVSLFPDGNEFLLPGQNWVYQIFMLGFSFSFWAITAITH